MFRRSPTGCLRPPSKDAGCGCWSALRQERDVSFGEAGKWGYTDTPNHCQGVKGFPESGRDRDVMDAKSQAVRAQSDQTLRDAMDIALLTGQRPADVLKIERAHILDGALFVAQNKTGAKRAIEVVGELAQVIERINARPRER